MYRILRIIFCILAAVCLAVAIPIGVAFGWQYLIILLAAAALFAALMFLMKNTPWKNKNIDKPDFMNTKDENFVILQQQKKNGESDSHSK